MSVGGVDGVTDSVVGTGGKEKYSAGRELPISEEGSGGTGELSLDFNES